MVRRFFLLILLGGVLQAAEPSQVYYSTLDSLDAVKNPVAGPPGEVMRGGMVFEPAVAGNGLTAAGPDGTAAAWGGSYKIPAEGLFGPEGTLEFWLKPRGGFFFGERAGMPVLFSSDGKGGSAFRVQYDLRDAARSLFFLLGEKKLSADISYWRPGEAHHVALAWSREHRIMRLYVDNVLFGRVSFDGFPSIRFLGINALLDQPGFQPNYSTLIDELKIWNAGLEDFSQVVSTELTRKTDDRYQIQELEPEKDAGLLGQTWRVVGEALDRAEVRPVGRNAIAVKADGLPRDGEIALRPEIPVPLKKTDKWIWIWVDPLTLRDVELSLLVKSSDGNERRLPVNIPKGHGWREGISAYLGGVRERLDSMRPGQPPHPAGTDLQAPVALTGLVIKPGFGKGVCYLRDLRIDDTDFLVTPYWRIFDFDDWLGPVGTGTPRLPVSSLLMRGRSGEDRNYYGSYAPPRTADAFEPLPAGTYQVDVEIRNRYQGGTVSVISEKIAYDPDALRASFGQSIALPEAPGTYWLNATIRDTEGRYVFGRRLRYYVSGAKNAASLPERSGLDRLGASLVALDTGYPNQIIVAPGKPAVTARFWVPNFPAKDLRYEWEITSPEVARPLRGGQPLVIDETHHDVRISCPTPETSSVFDLTVRVFDGDTLLDRRELRFGYRVPETPPQKSDKLPDYKQVLFPGPTIGLEAPFLDDSLAVDGKNLDKRGQFDLSAEQAAKLIGPETALVRVSLQWRDFEPLPGLYCFKELDDKIAVLRKHGLRGVIGLWTGWVPWMDYEPVVGQYGLERHGTADVSKHWRFFASTLRQSRLAPAYRDGITAAFQALGGHLLGEPTVVGYHTNTIDMFLDVGGIITDYSSSARSAFADFLRNQKGWTLDQVNARYGTAWKSWDEAQLPQAIPTEGRDLSNAWRDFSAFKQAAIRHALFGLCVNPLRTIGDPRPVFFYHENFGGNLDEYWGDCARLGIAPMGGAGNSPQEYVHHVRAAGYGGVYSHEPHSAYFYNPAPDEKMVDDVFSGAAATGGYGTMMFFYYHPRQPATDKSLWERVAAHVRALRERGPSTLPPFDVGIYLPADQDRFGARSFNSYPHDGMALSWEALYKDRILPSYLTRFTPPQAWNGLKLVCVEDCDVLSRDEIEKLSRYAREGGKLFFTSDDGRQVLESPEESFSLLQTLGFPESQGLTYSKDEKSEATLQPPFFKDCGKLSFRTGPLKGEVSLPPNAQVVGVFANGRPAMVRWPVGKGEAVVLFGKLHPYLQSGSASFFADLRRWAGIPKPNLTVTPNDPRVFASVSLRDNRQYLSVFRSGPRTYNRNMVGVKPDEPDTSIPVRVGLPRIPAGTYHVKRIGQGAKDLGTMSGGELSKGIATELKPSELQFFAIEPVAQ